MAIGHRERQQVTRRQWTGLVLGFAGLVLVVWRKLTDGSPGDHITAQLKLVAVTWSPGLPSAYATPQGKAGPLSARDYYLWPVVLPAGCPRSSFAVSPSYTAAQVNRIKSAQGATAPSVAMT